jgi:transcriptional regulator with XRE-family HTH domain
MDMKLLRRLKASKEYRDAYVASQIDVGLPFQIRALREARGWSQRDLAEHAGMLQPRISAVERPGYGRVNIETLRRLASAFDVALIIRFAPFRELIRWADSFSPDTFGVPSFLDDVQISSEGQQVREVRALRLAASAGVVAESRGREFGEAVAQAFTSNSVANEQITLEPAMNTQQPAFAVGSSG